jgi:hypothetical protein
MAASFVDASRQQLQFPTLTGTISKVFEISIRQAIIQQNGGIWVRQARKPPNSSLGDTWPVATLLGISGSARSLSAFAVFLVRGACNESERIWPGTAGVVSLGPESRVNGDISGGIRQV